jgi:hypothetical protein
MGRIFQQAIFFLKDLLPRNEKKIKKKKKPRSLAREEM